MFDMKKIGGYLSRLRKNADMTQMEFADRLNLKNKEKHILVRDNK